MSKLKQFLKNNKYILISGLTVFLVATIILIIHKVSPFGDRTILRMDLYHQYGPLFAELKQIFSGKGNLFYSMNSGGGSAFLGNYFNYLSSPFNFFVLLVPTIHIDIAIALMFIFKMGMIGISFSYYLKNSQNTKIDGPMLIGFSLMYAFCAYIIAYYWNIMWIDALYMLPFVILGLEKLIDEKSPVLYVISVFLTVFFNYYIGFMVCLFTIIYFLACFFSSKKTISPKSFIISLLRYILYSIVAFGLSCVVLIPIIELLKNSSATGDVFPNTISVNFEFLDFIANHFVSVKPTIRSSGTDVLPNVYSGMAIFILVPTFFLNEKINLRKRISRFIIIALLFIGMNINILNFIWHGLHFPNDLPYRFSFIYSFILITTAAEAFVNLDKKFDKKILFALFMSFAIIIAVQKLTSKNVTDLTIYLSLIFVLAYASFFISFSKINTSKNLLSFVFVLLVIAEVLSGSVNNFEINQDKSSYMTGYNEFKNYQKELKILNNDVFYREEMLYSNTKMNPSLYGYNGISVFSSMTNEGVSNFHNNLGLAGNYINSYTYSLQTPFYNSLFSMKYLYNNMPGLRPSIDYYDSKKIGSTYNLTENKYVLPPIIPVNKEVEKFTALKHRPFVNQQKLFQKFGFKGDLFTDVELTDYVTSNLEDSDDNKDDSISKFRKTKDKDLTSISTEFQCPKTANYYVYFAARGISAVDLYSTDGLSMNISLDEPSIIDLGQLDKDQQVFFNFVCKEDAKDIDLFSKAVFFNDDVFIKGYNDLKERSTTATMKNNTIQNDIIVNKDDIVLTSFPYDLGWNIYIDGEKINKNDYIKVGNALLAFKCSQGKHSIKLKYFPPGLIAGNLVFVVSLTIFIFLIKYEKTGAKQK